MKYIVKVELSVALQLEADGDERVDAARVFCETVVEDDLRSVIKAAIDTGSFGMVNIVEFFDDSGENKLFEFDITRPAWNIFDDFESN